MLVTGMNAGHQLFYLTRKPPTSIEEAFAIVLREDFSVMALRIKYSSPPPATQDPGPMEVDVIEHATNSRRAPNARFRKPVAPKRLVCFRCSKPGHHAAICRAPAPVLSVAASGVTVSADQPINDGNRPAVHYAQLNATTSRNDPRLIVPSFYVDGASRPLRALLDSGATNNVVRAESLPVIPSRLRVHES
ncbi:unnamed protein product [Peronospora belbahrii]|uniref:CCHC-type domain-containing protein n=1 Tax=Peronospora belbahrii TaxID=622444 RepID=A0AAU9KW77_9STRA|nr:unnamed protein product [Peronospora belbahrii]